jgi:heme-degrading monooxygenase HmoA
MTIAGYKAFNAGSFTRPNCETNMITRIWHGRTTVSKSDEYLNLMRTVAIPDYRSTPGNKGAYALRRIEGDTAHFLIVTFWESEDAVRAFVGDDISVAKYYDFDKSFLLELEPTSSHYETIIDRIHHPIGARVRALDAT